LAVVCSRQRHPRRPDDYWSKPPGETRN
jgi:hypothetical protein